MVPHWDFHCYLYNYPTPSPSVCLPCLEPVMVLMTLQWRASPSLECLQGLTAMVLALPLLLLLLFFLIIVVDLQCSVCFCHIAKWHSFTYIYIYISSFIHIILHHHKWSYTVLIYFRCNSWHLLTPGLPLLESLFFHVHPSSFLLLWTVLSPASGPGPFPLLGIFFLDCV